MNQVSYQHQLWHAYTGKDLEHIFERFYRVGLQISETGGGGLGFSHGPANNKIEW